ncbi:hypothetical protein [Nostoc sp. WHI]|uniref:hypothetical protein n=1 Tax=Nostoc sp. WHI TaxID=2650611 RepID=UPI0018C46057|nr:hypothetical protein [Nostoc sp. WHI]
MSSCSPSRIAILAKSQGEQLDDVSDRAACRREAVVSNRAAKVSRFVQTGVQG